MDPEPTRHVSIMHTTLTQDVHAPQRNAFDAYRARTKQHTTQSRNPYAIYIKLVPHASKTDPHAHDMCI
eukprot:2538605-Pyramimonas_sp.AAC.1